MSTTTSTKDIVSKLQSRIAKRRAQIRTQEAQLDVWINRKLTASTKSEAIAYKSVCCLSKEKIAQLVAEQKTDQEALKTIVTQRRRDRHLTGRLRWADGERMKIARLMAFCWVRLREEDLPAYHQHYKEVMGT